MHKNTVINKFITQEPEDNFTPWSEEVIANYTLEFYEKNIDSFIGGELENNWLNKVYNMILQNNKL